MRSQLSPKLEEKLKEIHSGKPSPETSRRRRFSRGILLIDIVVLIAVIVFFTNILHDTDYKTTSVSSSGLDYILSAKKTADSVTIIVNIINKTDKYKILDFTKYNFSINLHDRFNKTFFSKRFAPNSGEIKILSGESKNFVTAIPLSLFKEHSESNPDSITESVDKPFSFGKSDIPFVIIFNTGYPADISTKLNFSIEVK